jgi:hypothetical protein
MGEIHLQLAGDADYQFHINSSDAPICGRAACRQFLTR